MSSVRGRFLAPAVITAAAALVCGPVLLSSGYVLVGDMTFVPEQPWKDAWLGLDGSAPRAVPADALVAWATQVLPGDLLQKLVLLGTLVAAGLGMLRLVSHDLGVTSRAAGLAAALLFVWNPYVHERLAIGHWGLLIGYAALPWIAHAALAVRRADPGAWPRLALAVAPAAFGSPTGGLLAGIVVLVLVIGPGTVAPVLRRAAGALAIVVLLDLPWLVPGLVGAETGSDPGGVDAFAARSDTPLGLWGSLLTFGGIWKESIVAGERDAWLLVLLALAITIASLVALVRSPHRRLLGLGLVGLLLAGLPATGVGSDLVGTLVEHVPGAGVLRDSQKWIALLALAACAGFALLVRGIADAFGSRGIPAGLPRVVLAAVPLVLLPSLAWGLAGDYEPVDYPDEWSEVSDVLDAQPAAVRRTVVLPFSAYQALPWNDRRAALDPAIRYFPGEVVTNDELRLSAQSNVAGDSADAALIAAAVRAGGPLEPVLARTGVRFVLVERTAAGAQGIAVPGGSVLHEGPELLLLDLGNPVDRNRAQHRGLIIAGDLAAALTLVVTGSLLALRRIRRINDEIG